MLACQIPAAQYVGQLVIGAVKVKKEEGFNLVMQKRNVVNVADTSFTSERIMLNKYLHCTMV